jgi:uncharacterized membrane protein YgcG
MKSIGLSSLSLLLAVTAGSASAQEIPSLVSLNPANQSASAAVTRSIAAYIAARNGSAAVQEMARPQSGKAADATVEALLVAIETNSRIAQPEKPPQVEQQPTETSVKTGSGGGRGGSGGGSGGGGGGGWN